MGNINWISVTNSLESAARTMAIKAALETKTHHSAAMFSDARMLQAISNAISEGLSDEW